MPSKSRSDPKPAEVADRLHSAAIHLLRRLRRVDEASGLSAPKLSALSVVVFAGPIRLGDLAAAEQIRPPSMTRIVQQLESQGVVRREPDPGDGRATRIAATPKGHRLLKQGRGRRVNLLVEWLGGLDTADIHKLEKGLVVLEQLLKK
ncbi:MAG: MarR family transcriptional regulator [Phycisphaerales bacterium]|nr:MarR family transcriptional regulator [Phycisphaerales bacterium]